MAGTGVDQLTGVGVEHRAEGGGASRARQSGREPVEAHECGTGAGMFQQKCPARAAELSHHRRRGKAVPHTVAHDQRDAPIVEVDHVVPVATHLKRAGRG